MFGGHVRISRVRESTEQEEGFATFLLLQIRSVWYISFMSVKAAVHSPISVYVFSGSLFESTKET